MPFFSIIFILSSIAFTQTLCFLTSSKYFGCKVAKLNVAYKSLTLYVLRSGLFYDAVTCEYIYLSALYLKDVGAYKDDYSLYISVTMGLFIGASWDDSCTFFSFPS